MLQIFQLDLNVYEPLVSILTQKDRVELTKGQSSNESNTIVDNFKAKFSTNILLSINNERSIFLKQSSQLQLLLALDFEPLLLQKTANLYQTTTFVYLSLNTAPNPRHPNVV